MNNPFFSKIQQITKLNNQELAAFIALGKEDIIPSKKYLTQPNFPVKEIFFLKKGIVRHFFKGKKGNEFTKNFIAGPRFMCPSLSDFFLQTPSCIYCQSLTELEVIRWDYQGLFQFAEENPMMYKMLLTSVVSAFKGKESKEISMNQKEAKERYLEFIETQPKVAGNVPLQYIASYLNIRPETLSRIRANLIS